MKNVAYVVCYQSPDWCVRQLKTFSVYNDMKEGINNTLTSDNVYQQNIGIFTIFTC